MNADGPAGERFEVLVGLRVTDQERYARYREGMMPLLERMGGFFRYDMRVSEVLRGGEPDSLNRVFVISFPDRETKDRFFSDAAYLAVRAEHFEPSVDHAVVMAEYVVR